jgi:iron(III) transport system permease protein
VRALPRPRWPIDPGLDARFAAGTIGLLAFLVIGPLAVLLYSSVRTGRPFLPGGEFTLDNYATVFASPANVEAIGNSVVFAVASTAVSLFLALALAWLVERTDMPLRATTFTLVLLPLAIPGTLYAISWILLLSPEIGAVNGALRGAVGSLGLRLDRGPFDVYTLPGLILVDGLRGVPSLFLLLGAAFRNLDPALEEAAQASGGRLAALMRRVTLPLLLPATAAAAIYNLVGSLESFEIPGLIGLPAGIYLFSTRIYWAVNVKSPADFGLGNAFAVTFLVTSLVLIWVYRRLVRRSERFATVTGKAYRPRRFELGSWRYAALAGALAYVLAAVALPLAVLAWTSLHPFVRVPSIEGLATLTLANYATLAAYPGLLDAVRNTLVLLALTATATAAIAFAVSWVVMRSRLPGRGAIDSLAFTPHTIPSVVIGLAVLLLYLGPLRAIPIYATVGILVVALTTRYLAYSTRSANAALVQLHRDLEDASAMSGAGTRATFTRVVLPLVAPAVMSVWLWVAIHATRETTIPLMLYSTENAVVSTKLWFMWVNGAAGQAAALGILMVAALALVSAAGRFAVARMRRD